MKVAIFSDVHGNFEALKCVYADIEQNDVATTVCLGDMVGYGPEPEAVVKFIIQNGIPGVAGNHELAILEDEALEGMNARARASILITRNLVSETTLDFIGQLPRHSLLNEMRLVHGMPPDSATTYLNWVGDDEIVECMKAVSQRMIFVGHTHRPIVYSLNATDLDAFIPKEGKTRLQRETQYIVNVGSVGQPRDGDARARYVIYDSDADEVELRFVDYDYQKTADRIIALGFPIFNARRLFPQMIE